MVEDTVSNKRRKAIPSPLPSMKMSTFKQYKWDENPSFPLPSLKEDLDDKELTKLKFY